MAPRKWKCESQYVVQFLLDLGRSTTTSAGVTHAFCIVLMIAQSVFIHIFLKKYMSAWVLLTLVVEVPLLAHMLWHWRGEAAYRSNPTTWLGYCWVQAGKVVVIFVRVLPRLPNPLQEQPMQGFQELGGLMFDQLFTPTMLGNLLYITPVIYTLLMFRTSRAIFGKFSNYVTFDLILHYDMLWHVVIDMVDQVDMLSYARMAEMMDKTVYAESVRSLVLIQTLVPFFLFVSMVLQAQAFPGVIVDHWKIPPPASRPRVPAHDEQGPSFTELQQQTAGVPSAPMYASERSLTSADRPTNTEDGQDGERRQRPSLPAAKPPKAPELGHLEAMHVAPPFHDLMPESPPEPDAAVDSPQPQSEQGNSGVPATAAPAASDTRNRPQQPVLPIPTAAATDSAGAVPRGGPGIRTSRTGMPLTPPETGPTRETARMREERLYHERERRRKLQAIVHAIRRQSIIIARKRSAMVSIFFTDVPFLAVRLWVFLAVGHGYFHGLAIKNVICILLNIMQYTFVRYASGESSRDIQEQLAEYSVRFAAKGDSAASLGNSAGSVMSPSLHTPYSEIAGSNMSTPEGHKAEAKRRQLYRQAAEKAEGKVLQERVRSPGVCGYFMAIVLPFVAGFVLAKGEAFFDSLYQQLKDEVAKT